MVADHAAREADQDRREGGPARSIRHVPDGRGRNPEKPVRGNPATDRRLAAEASADMTPAVIAAIGLNRRPLDTRQLAERPSSRTRSRLGRVSEAPSAPSRVAAPGCMDHASDQCSIVLPSLMLGRNHLENPSSYDALCTSLMGDATRGGIGESLETCRNPQLRWRTSNRVLTPQAA